LAERTELRVSIFCWRQQVLGSNDSLVD
jgi:hypothetical protein